jgi:hypothetical protein
VPDSETLLRQPQRVGFDENKGIECIRLECASIAMGTACLTRAAAATTNELLIFIDDA